MRRIGLAVLCCLLTSEAVACVADASFFNESEAETLIACLEGSEGQQFLSGRDASLATVLHLAIATDLNLLVLDAIRRAASDGWPDLRDRVDSDGRTALHVAAETTKDADSVRWLLQWGADPNAMYTVNRRLNPLRWDYGIAPLHLAAARADGADVVSALLAGGADPEIRRPPDDTTWTAALEATRHAQDVRTLAALAAGGANLTAVGQEGNNALHVSAAWDRPPAVTRFLIESGVEVDAKNQSQQTPLHLAARYASKIEAITLLLDVSADPCAEDSQGRTAAEVLKAANETLSDNPALQRRFHEICVEGD